MQVRYELNENKNVALALGFFDGVHLAHQTLIKKTVELAKKNNVKSVLLTFLKSPSSIILNKTPLYITSTEKKLELIEDLGIDETYLLDFNRYKTMRADNYLREVILKYFYPKYVITGFNHTFGLNKEGDSKLLSVMKSVFEYVEIPPVTVSNILVSSTNIKNMIKEGEFILANKMLNRNFSIKGKVINGNKIARTLGYKTANIIWNSEIQKPQYGVYAGLAIYKGVSYQALINFGIRPSVDKDLCETLEVHLIGFSGELYGDELEVEFCSKIRNEIKFDSINDLKEQIDKDYKKLISYPLYYSTTL